MILVVYFIDRETIFSRYLGYFSLITHLVQSENIKHEDCHVLLRDPPRLDQ